MLKKRRKKNYKNLKILKKEKKVWRYGGEGANHKILPGSMQQCPRNLSLQTNLLVYGRMRHDSSSADKVKQS